MSVSGLLGQNGILNAQTVQTNNLIVGGNAFTIGNRGTFVSTGATTTQYTGTVPNLTPNSQVLLTMKSWPPSGTFNNSNIPRVAISLGTNTIAFYPVSGDFSTYNWMVIG